MTVVESTSFQHFTVLGDGTIGDLQDGFEAPPGPGIMAMKVWANDTDEAVHMLTVIGRQIGFDVQGEIQVFETEPDRAPTEHPFGYDITFTAYSDDEDDDSD